MHFHRLFLRCSRLFSIVCLCFSSFKLFLDVRVILSCFLVLEEVSKCVLLFSVPCGCVEMFLTF